MCFIYKPPSGISSYPANTKSLFISDICKEALGLEEKADATKVKFVTSDNSWLHPFIKRKGTSNLKLEEVMNKDNDYIFCMCFIKKY